MNAAKFIRPLLYGLSIAAIIFFVIGIFRCNATSEEILDLSKDSSLDESYLISSLTEVLLNSRLPQHIPDRILGSREESLDFIQNLYMVMQGDPYLWLLVDKQNSVGSEYEPLDLVDLGSASYRMVSNHALRRDAAASLEEKAAAAKEEGLTLTVLSAFRPYFYQGRIYTYYVTTEGQEEADKISARPGHSQHQLGLAVDLNILDNALAQTPEGIWLAENASRFGWSLSYPYGYEQITGYSFESWHYRYVGVKLAEFIEKYFDGVQQYALRFIQEWENVEM